MTETDEFLARYGPWALVTGASSGIGEHLARRLAARGCNLVVAARRIERLEMLARDLRAVDRVEVEVLQLDLGEPRFLEHVMTACDDKDVGLIVSNAGLGLKGLHAEQSDERLDALLAVNCRAPMLLSRAFAPRLLARGRGGIVLVGSIEGFQGYPYSAAYAASKGFVHSLGEGLWGELAPGGVDVLVVAPGGTDTEILADQGIDKKALVGVMAPGDVAERAISHLGRGPVYVVGASNKALVGALRLMPRRLALRAAGAGMRQTLDRSERRRKRAAG
ncbi:MAG TPA: SDR family oxidoreductase [Acidimicrobiales bacterium]|nr:SDR family oxidoreductase [Acidimicrobiales bacterium]